MPITMVDSRVRVSITKNDRCIFENVTDNQKDNDLKELIKTLKETQQKVNEFLTTLVHEEQNDLTKGEFNDLESDTDEDSIEESNPRDNPKKCKLSV